MRLKLGIGARVYVNTLLGPIRNESREEFFGVDTQ